MACFLTVPLSWTNVRKIFQTPAPEGWDTARQDGSWSDDDGAVAFLLYAGGRLTYVQAEVDVNRGPSPDRSAGARALSHNYDTGTDGDLFRWDVNMHGPILGLTIRF